MASSFFVKILGQQRGPIGVSALKKLASDGELSPSDYVSRDGREWTLAGDVKGLAFPEPRAADPPPRSENANNGNRREAPQFDPSELLVDVPMANGASTATMSAPPLPPGLAPAVEHSPLNLIACPDCRELVSMRAAMCLNCGRPIRTPPGSPAVEKRYLVLRVLAGTYRIMGALLALLALMATAGALSLFGDPDSQLNILAKIQMFFGILGIISAAIMMFGIAEAILVFIQIEENTRTANSILCRPE